MAGPTQIKKYFLVLFSDKLYNFMSNYKKKIKFIFNI